MRSFQFNREFNAEGEVVSVPGSRHVTREHAEEMVQEALRKASAGADAEAARALSDIAARLRPVPETLAEISARLRREAVDLAMAGAEAVIGTLLDARGAEFASRAIGEQAKRLPSAARVEVKVAENNLAEVSERLRTQGASAAFCVGSAPGMKPGDWRVEWEDGAIGFDAEDARARIAEAMRRCLDDPCDPQGDLFAETG